MYPLLRRTLAANSNSREVAEGKRTVWKAVVDQLRTLEKRRAQIMHQMLAMPMLGGGRLRIETKKSRWTRATEAGQVDVKWGAGQ